MHASKAIRNSGLVLLLVFPGMGYALPSFADHLPSAAPAAGSHAKPATIAVQSVELGKVQVKAMRELVKTLQQVKVALKTPFTDHAADVDQMVCQIHTSMGRASLECGTQGWFSMRREAYHTVFFGGPIAVPMLGHPWHTVRVLNYRQLMVLRKLLKQLLPPGQPVKVIGAQGKALFTIQPGGVNRGGGN